MIAELKRPTISDFRDPTRYVKVPDRNLFDEGEVRYLEKVFDDDGNPVIDPKTGKQKLKEVVWEVNQEVLQHIAAVNNARNEAGDVSPISIGHNDLRNPDEQAQPPLVGAAGDYHVAWDEPHKKWMLRASYYFRREDFDAAKTYPFTSIELHPSDGTIHPVSLIRRAPKRDLGAWTTFSRDGSSCYRVTSRFDTATRRHATVIQYMRELPDTEMNLMVDQPNETPETPEAPPEADHGEMVHQFMRDTMPYLHHITQHPHYGHMVSQYARDAEDDVNPDDQAPVGEPNATPAEDAEGDQPPVQNGAFPSATNTFMPGNGKKEDKEPMQNARTPNDAAPATTQTPPATTPAPAAAPAAPNKAATEPSQFARDIQAQQYSRLAEGFEALMKKVDALTEKLETKDRESAQALHFSRCAAGVQALIHQHNRIVEDPDFILENLKATPADKLDEQVLKFAKILPHDIAGLSRDSGFVRTPASPNNGFTAPEPDEDEVGQLSPHRSAQVFQYQRDRNLWGDEGFEKAKKECPKNYRAAQAPKLDSPAARN